MPLVRFESLITGSFCSHRTCRPRRLSASCIAPPKGRVTSATLTSEPGELLRNQLPTPREPPKRLTVTRRAESKRSLNPFSRTLAFKHLTKKSVLEPSHSRLRTLRNTPISRASVPVPRRVRAQNACVNVECSGALLRAHCLRRAPKSSSMQRAHFRALKLTYEPSFPGVPSPTTSLRCGQRPAPGLPHPAPLRLQVFSTS